MTISALIAGGAILFLTGFYLGSWMVNRDCKAQIKFLEHELRRAGRFVK